MVVPPTPEPENELKTKVHAEGDHTKSRDAKEHSFYTPGAQAKQICEVIVKLIVIISVSLKHVN